MSQKGKGSNQNKNSKMNNSIPLTLLEKLNEERKGLMALALAFLSACLKKEKG
jgi:hypothetical protein